MPFLLTCPPCSLPLSCRRLSRSVPTALYPHARYVVQALSSLAFPPSWRRRAAWGYTAAYAVAVATVEIFPCPEPRRFWGRRRRAATAAGSAHDSGSRRFGWYLGVRPSASVASSERRWLGRNRGLWKLPSTSFLHPQSLSRTCGCNNSSASPIGETDARAHGRKGKRRRHCGRTDGRTDGRRAWS